MQLGTQQQVEGYLRSAGYNILNTEKGFIVADQPGMAGDRDTLLVWIPSDLFPGRAFEHIEVQLLNKIDSAARSTLTEVSKRGFGCPGTQYRAASHRILSRNCAPARIRVTGASNEPNN